MPYYDCAEFIAALPIDAAVAALDPGKKRVGLAVGSLALRIALPITVLQREAFAGEATIPVQLLRERNVAALVVGLPLHMNGSAGASAQSARDFAGRLEKILSLPVLLADERLSTAAAQRMLLTLDTKRSKREEVIDAHAAAVILQSFFDRSEYLI